MESATILNENFGPDYSSCAHAPEPCIRHEFRAESGVMETVQVKRLGEQYRHGNQGTGLLHVYFAFVCPWVLVSLSQPMAQDTLADLAQALLADVDITAVDVSDPGSGFVFSFLGVYMRVAPAVVHFQWVLSSADGE